jgi:hypothetical protein
MTTRLLATLAVLVVATTAALTTSAEAADTVTISGTVLTDTGAPLAGATVMLSHGGDPIAATTPSSGRYTFTVAVDEDHDYSLEYSAPGHLPDDRRFFSEASELAGIDVQLIRPASISGRALDRSGRPLADVFVRVQTIHGSWGFGEHTDANGRYAFEGFLPHLYTVTFNSPGASSTITSYGAEDGRPHPIVLKPGQDITLRDQVVPFVPKVGGLVVNDTRPASRQESVQVLVHPAHQERAPSYDTWLTSEFHRALFPELFPGTYKISFGEHGWWGGHSFETANVITIEAGRTLTLNLAPPKRRAVTANVQNREGTALNDLVMAVYDSTHRAPVAVSTIPGSSGQGRQELTDLRKGNYTVTYLDPAGIYATTTGQPSTGLDDVTTLRRRSGEPKIATGPKSATVSGTRSGPRRTDAVCFVPANGDTTLDNNPCVDGENSTAKPDGYSVELRPGDYKVQLGGTTSFPRYSTYFWLGGRSFSSAATISVGAGEHRDVDIPALPTVGDLVGSVLDERGNKIAPITVLVYAADNPQEVIARTTRDNVEYMFASLPVRPYKLRFVDVTGRYSSTWYGGSTFASATTIAPWINHNRLVPNVTMKQKVTALARPSISGRAREKSRLTTTDGYWSRTGLTLTRKWLRNGHAIKGATHRTYKLTKSDRGKTISVRVTAKRGSTRVTSSSASTSRVTRR